MGVQGPGRVRPRPQSGGLLGMAQNMGVQPNQRRSRERSLGPTRMVGNVSRGTPDRGPGNVGSPGGFRPQARPQPQPAPRVRQPVSQPPPQLQGPVSQPASGRAVPQIISDPGGQAQPPGLSDNISRAQAPAQQNQFLGLLSALGGGGGGKGASRPQPTPQPGGAGQSRSQFLPQPRINPTPFGGGGGKGGKGGGK